MADNIGLTSNRGFKRGESLHMPYDLHLLKLKWNLILNLMVRIFVQISFRC
jgi:hypothetical protein